MTTNLITHIGDAHRNFLYNLAPKNEHPSSYITAHDGKSAGLKVLDNVAIPSSSYWDLF